MSTTSKEGTIKGKEKRMNSFKEKKYYHSNMKFLSLANFILEFSRNLVATILPTVVVDKYKPAPAVAYFSGTGPIYRNYNLIKVKHLSLSSISVYYHHSPCRETGK